MTPKQVALVQDSFVKVALSEAAAVLFYDRLFDVTPQMKAMFPEDMIGRNVHSVGVTAFGGLIELLRISKKDDTVCSLRDSQDICERHLSGFIDDQHIECS